MGTKVTESLTREERWAKDDEDLRIHGLFGGRAVEAPPFAYGEASGELQAAVDDLYVSYEDLPPAEAKHRTLSALARLNRDLDRKRSPRAAFTNARIRAPVALQLSVHHNRALLMGRPSTLTEAEWTAIYASFRGRCAYCEEAKARTIDHVIPLSRGGAHCADNVVPACRPCNSRKGARPLHEMLERDG